MDADAVDRPTGSGAGATDPGARGGTVALTVAVLAVSVAGGWWWRANEPVTGPAGRPPVAVASDRPVAVASDRPVADETVLLDGNTGAIVTRTAPGEGQVTVVIPGDDGDGLGRFPGTVWQERRTLTPERGVVRRTRSAEGVRYLLQFRCTGPGELLVVVDGGRAADPFTTGCSGSTTTTQMTATGGPFQVSLSTAGTEPLRMEAQLVAIP
ncbi:hypothetical protein [Micromonospora endolithica]|uniref:Uncharacterized protein n=1 Tax=Micromonospora endolithica TaxID=230091 RepID=A0A3A9YS82_9ACTN|nr:hypothetical protein [Micromonospora endolithica]RKN38850.1 hypothetical protein D7223_29890 [Micromonospora endolithica]TWJ25475.1 hypothetical protein JD76_05646 [Micromonospora endolithica]